MRRLILHMLISTDGFIADSEGSNNFGINWDQQQQQFHIELFNNAGGLVYGRGVFEKYVTYWEGVADGKRPGGEPMTKSRLRNSSNSCPSMWRRTRCGR